MEIAAEPNMWATRQRVAHLAVAKLRGAGRGAVAGQQRRSASGGLHRRSPGEGPDQGPCHYRKPGARLHPGQRQPVCHRLRDGDPLADFYVQRVVAETDVRSAAGFTWGTFGWSRWVRSFSLRKPHRSFQRRTTDPAQPFSLPTPPLRSTTPRKPTRPLTCGGRWPGIGGSGWRSAC